MTTDPLVTILFVDDEEGVLNSLKRLLRKESFASKYANNAFEALEILAQEHIDIMVTDLRMPKMGGLELIEQVKEKYPHILRLVASATRDIEQTVQTINAGGIYRFISKPFEPQLFKVTIQNAIEFYQLRCEREQLTRSLATANAELQQNNCKLDDAYRELLQAKHQQDKLQQQAKTTESRIAEQLLQAQMPAIEGVSLGALARPAKHITGDFYECLNYESPCFDLIIADVMGKGSLPALIGAGLKGIILKTLAQVNSSLPPLQSDPTASINQSLQIEKILSKIHNMAISKLMELETFATLNFARFDLSTQQMTYIDCGHTRTIHYCASEGRSHLLSGEAPPLGIVEQFDYHASIVELNRGDLLLFYSDGLTEAENSAGEEFGEAGLISLVEREHTRPIPELLQTIHAEIVEHSSPNGLVDDFTCVAVRIDY